MCSGLLDRQKPVLSALDGHLKIVLQYDRVTMDATSVVAEAGAHEEMIAGDQTTSFMSEQWVISAALARIDFDTARGMEGSPLTWLKNDDQTNKLQELHKAITDLLVHVEGKLKLCLADASVDDIDIRKFWFSWIIPPAKRVPVLRAQVAGEFRPVVRID